MNPMVAIWGKLYELIAKILAKREVENLQTISFSIFPRKVTIEAGEYCWENILVFIQLNPTHTEL